MSEVDSDRDSRHCKAGTRELTKPARDPTHETSHPHNYSFTTRVLLLWPPLLLGIGNTYIRHHFVCMVVVYSSHKTTL